MTLKYTQFITLSYCRATIFIKNKKFKYFYFIISGLTGFLRKIQMDDYQPTMKTDLSYLECMAEGDPVLISEMIEIFSTQVMEYTGLMHEYLEREDWQELSKLAHKAKSSAAIMGMKGLTEKLKKLEKLAKEEKEVNSFPGYIEHFSVTSREAVTELNKYLSTL